MIINNLRDDELIFFLSLHGDRAIRSIEYKYDYKSQFLVKETLARFPKISSTKDILKNICFYSLSNTIKRIDIRKFGIVTYWRRCSMNLMRTLAGKEIKYQYNHVSLDSEVELKDSSVSLHEVIPSKEIREHHKLDKDDVDNLLKEMGFDIDIEEKRLFKSYLNGRTYDELNRLHPEYSRSKIYRIVNRCKNKIRARLCYNTLKCKN